MSVNPKISLSYLPLALILVILLYRAPAITLKCTDASPKSERWVEFVNEHPASGKGGETAHYKIARDQLTNKPCSSIVERCSDRYERWQNACSRALPLATGPAQDAESWYWAAMEFGGSSDLVGKKYCLFRARTIALEARAKNPENVRTWQILPFVFGELNESQSAIETSRSILKIAPSFEHHELYVETLAGNHEVERAAVEYANLVRLVSTKQPGYRIVAFEQSWFSVGMTFEHCGSYDLATDSFLRDIEISNGSGLDWLNLACATYLAGRKDEAVVALAAASKRRDKDTYGWDRFATRMKAMGRPDVSFDRAFAQMVRKAQNQPDARNCLTLVQQSGTHGGAIANQAEWLHITEDLGTKSEFALRGARESKVFFGEVRIARRKLLSMSG